MGFVIVPPLCRRQMELTRGHCTREHGNMNMNMVAGYHGHGRGVGGGRVEGSSRLAYR